MKLEEIKKLIEKNLKSYRLKEIPLPKTEKKYKLYLFSEDESINLFEGFLLSDVKNKNEYNQLIGYRPPVSGYVSRISLLFFNDYLIIKDYRRDRTLKKSLDKLNKTFLSKFQKALKNPTETNLDKLFDRTDVIEEFYILYQKSRELLLKNIRGIADEDQREEFVDNFMMQMLTLWYLQERGFFNDDSKYFITKFKDIVEQKRLSNGFKSYYDFLTYFFEKVGNHIDEQYYKDEITGEVTVVGPAIFINGELESEAISIPDKCFYKDGNTKTLVDIPPKKVSREVPLFNLFESRDWTHGNIDEFVLGALYEKLITHLERKRLGAYYTPEEITKYISKNTIEPYLLDRVNEKFDGGYDSLQKSIEAGDKELLLYLFDQLREIKILDPAVGSAHFLESAINVLVDIYEKIWDKAQRMGLKEGFEIIAADEKGNIKNIKLLEISDKEQFRMYIKFFIILSKNIYGVDISSSAIKVAKARLFLTLAKHFDAKKGYFIRFPNVHFNLRTGNSLVGYTDLEEEAVEGQLTLSLFVKESDAEYIAQMVKLPDELEGYISSAARELRLEGDIKDEISELNRMLSKKEMNWKDFKKVLKTKERLIKILIASLNSQHARPLNELINNITELFNSRLDEKFAEEHDIDLETLKGLECLPYERKMFHWVFEFPEVFIGDSKKGFDVIIGNPPYGRLKQIIKNREEKLFVSNFYKDLFNKQHGNLNQYKLFLERSYYLLHRSGYFSMIFPSSFLGENASVKLRKHFFEDARVCTVLEFPEKAKVFIGVTQSVTIFIYKKGKIAEDYELAINSNIKREEKENLSSLEFLRIRRSELEKMTEGDYRIPLFANPIVEWKILKHVTKFPPFKGDEDKPPLGELGEGHLHETFDKEFMSDEKGDELLIKGTHLGRYFVNLDPDGPKPRWIKGKKKFLEKKPTAIQVIDRGRLLWKRSVNRSVRNRLQFGYSEKPFVMTNTVCYVIPYDGFYYGYLLCLLNSNLLLWKFKITSYNNDIRIYQVEALPIPRIPLEEQRPFIILAKYLLFLKQYQNYFAPEDKHIQYVVEYFENLVDCLVYELYLGDVVEVEIKSLVEGNLEDFEFPENLLEAPEGAVKDLVNKTLNVYNNLESKDKLKENLFQIKLHPWVKQIYEALE